MFSKFLSKYSEYSILLLRIALGSVFVLHGGMKLFGGLEMTSKFFAMMHIEPSYTMAVIVGCMEFFGGLLVLLGLFTRVGAFLITCVMIGAILTVHISHGYFMQNGGFEYPLTLMLIAISLMFSGGGKLSVDKDIIKTEII